MQKITYTNKQDIVSLPDIANENKVTASDMNQIKTVINANALEYDNDKKATDLGLLPIGTILTIGANSEAPNNFLKLNGQAISKTTYSALYAIIGDTYGSNTNTFNLPNQNYNPDNASSDIIPSYCYIIRAL